MFSQIKTDLITRMLLSLIMITLLLNNFASGQDSDGEKDSYSKYYISVNGVRFSGTEYPTRFDGYKTLDDNKSFLSNNFFGVPDSKFGFGAVIGYVGRDAVIYWGLEVEYMQSAYSDGTELFEEVIWKGVMANPPHEFKSYSFTQTERKNSAVSGNLFVGIFPFTDVNLGFNFTVGFGIGWQTLKSNAVIFAEQNGYNAKDLANDTDYDLGEYDQGGVFNRSSFIAMIGGGTELFLSQIISLKFDYKYIVSTYSRENVLISGGGGGPNVYQNKKEYEYTFAHKVGLGVYYYFDL